MPGYKATKLRKLFLINQFVMYTLQGLNMPDVLCPFRDSHVSAIVVINTDVDNVYKHAIVLDSRFQD